MYRLLIFCKKVMPIGVDIVKYECLKVKIYKIKKGLYVSELIIYNGKVYTEDGKIDNGYIHVKDGQIVAIGEVNDKAAIDNDTTNKNSSD